MKLYKKCGKEYKGATHKDSSGKIMSGKTHTKNSQFLYTLKELEKKGLKKKIKTGGTEHVIHKNKKGEVVVHHTKIEAGKYDKLNLTKKAGVKTIKEGVAATKKWHKNNPHKKYKK